MEAAARLSASAGIHVDEAKALLAVDHERDLLVALGALMETYGAATSAGLDASAILAGGLRNALGDQWDDLPPVVRMMLG